jgi:hypothetical protein
MSELAFLPDGYEVPTSGGGFTKLEPGDNKFRILSSPLMMWLIWDDGKPKRVKFDRENKPAKGAREKDSVKHAWGLVVWNYKTEVIEVFELDKQSVIADLYKYAADEDWGHPKHYDIVINKSGSGMDTEYSFIAKPKKAPAQAIVDAFLETPVDLKQLLVENGNVFLSNGGSQASTAPAAAAEKVVTPDNWAKGDAIPDGYVADGDAIKKKALPF